MSQPLPTPARMASFCWWRRATTCSTLSAPSGCCWAWAPGECTMSHARATHRLLALAAALGVAACSPKGSYQAMAEQPRYEAYEGSDTLPHGASVQPLVEGVVARGYLRDDSMLVTGLAEDGT